LTEPEDRSKHPNDRTILGTLNERTYRTLLISALIISLVLVLAYFLIGPTENNWKEKVAQVTLAIAASIFATAAFSIWMMLSRTIEVASALHRETERDAQFLEKLNALNTELKKYRTASERMSEIRKGLLAPFILTKEPRDDLVKLMQVPDTHPLHISFLGIDIHSIYDEHLDKLRGRPDTFIRVILPDPESKDLATMCTREGRQVRATKQSIQEMTRRLANRRDFPNSDVRWAKTPSPLTIVEVEHSILWRPRLSHEQERDEHFCGLLLESQQPELFRIIRKELLHYWETATPQHYNDETAT
jgi:hypothetical protein